MNLEQAIDECDVTLDAWKREPENLYKHFQYYCAMQEVQSYGGIIR